VPNFVVVQKQAMVTGETFQYMDKSLEDVTEHDEYEAGPSSPSRTELKRKRDDSEEKKRKKKEKKKLKKEEKKRKKKNKVRRQPSFQCTEDKMSHYPRSRSPS